MIKFGYCLPIFAWPGARLFRTPAYSHLDAATTMKLGKQAEDLGYHSIWVADHLMLGKDEAILEGWTTLCAIAGMTQRVQLGIIHYNNAFRHPALTAKAVATLDQISVTSTSSTMATSRANFLRMVCTQTTASKTASRT